MKNINKLLLSVVSLGLLLSCEQKPEEAPKGDGDPVVDPSDKMFI